MTCTPSTTLIERCVHLYFHPQFGNLTLGHPMRMAAVFAFLADELTPEEPEPAEAEDFLYEFGWWRSSSLIRHELLREVDSVVGPISKAPMPSLIENPCDPGVQQERQNFLDWLYDQSGRTNALYTGLYDEYIKAKSIELNEEPCH